jgi:hypothetical protein
MLSNGGRLLADDHVALDKLQGQLKSALRAGDVEGTHSRLDTFWSRLAVHIRAEHQQLFPAVIDALTISSRSQTFAPTLTEARSTIEKLRSDHDFFMHELAQAIKILRALPHEDRETIDRAMNSARSTMIEIEKRFVIHNQLEETKIYAWTTTILNSREQTDLATRIRIELANRPPRFSLDEWTTPP